MIIAIGGQQLAGKSTLATMLSKITGLHTLSTSEYLLQKVSTNLQLAPHIIVENKHLFRDEYEAAGDKEEALHGPAGVMRMTLKGFTGQDVILESIRRGIEVTFLKSLPDVLYVLVESDRETRSKRGTLANESAKTETEGIEALLQIPDLIKVQNTGSMEDLQRIAESIAKQARELSAVAQ